MTVQMNITTVERQAGAVLNNMQGHHQMNLPERIGRKIGCLVPMARGGADVEKRLANLLTFNSSVTAALVLDAVSDVALA
jgi:hypothetical protein